MEGCRLLGSPTHDTDVTALGGDVRARATRHRVRPMKCRVFAGRRGVRKVWHCACMSMSTRTSAEAATPTALALLADLPCSTPLGGPAPTGSLAHPRALRFLTSDRDGSTRRSLASFASPSALRLRAPSFVLRSFLRFSLPPWLPTSGPSARSFHRGGSWPLPGWPCGGFEQPRWCDARRPRVYSPRGAPEVASRVCIPARRSSCCR